MRPTTRQEFIKVCLQNLGAPVIEINVDDDQIDNRVDFALTTWWDYHFDGSTKEFYKFEVTDQWMPGSLSEVVVANGGTGYSNSDTVVITSSYGSGATATLTTDANGSITEITVTNYGSKYNTPPTITINTSTGSGARFEAYNGGYIPLPQNIIGAVRIFDMGYTMGAVNNPFNLQYQIVMNDLYSITTQSVVPYFMTFQYLQMLEQLFVGQQPIRYNRHKNRLYIDMNWSRTQGSKFFVVEAYSVVDPDVYTDAWADRWLQQYATALIKKQWGNNLKKFKNMQMTGGIQFSGQEIYDEAEKEIEKLEESMINDFSLPVSDMIG